MNCSSYPLIKPKTSLIAGICIIASVIIFSGCAGTSSSAKTIGIAPGNAIPNIITVDTSGNWLELHALKGCYVLVEFWESGNMDARKNHFEINRLYKKYHNADFKDGKKFCVYSVSLDTDKQKWLAALEQDNISWPHQTIDTKAWNAQAAKDFGVHFLPKYYLVNGDGVIINRNIIIDNLETIIQSELN